MSLGPGSVQEGGNPTEDNVMPLYSVGGGELTAAHTQRVIHNTARTILILTSHTNVASLGTKHACLPSHMNLPMWRKTLEIRSVLKKIRLFFTESDRQLGQLLATIYSAHARVKRLEEVGIVYFRAAASLRALLDSKYSQSPRIFDYRCT